MKIKLAKVKCLRCGWVWAPRKADVRMCPNPKCKSVLFDVPLAIPLEPPVQEIAQEPKG